MRTTTRTLGRIAATAGLVVTLAGAGSSAAFAADVHAVGSPQAVGHSSSARVPATLPERHLPVRLAAAAPAAAVPIAAPAPAVSPVTVSTGTDVASSDAATAAASGTVVSTAASTLTTSSGNDYTWGNCTWYAYERRLQLGRPIGSSWGNANQWAVSAAAAGYVVTRTPAVGDVLVSTQGALGHVAVVESVADDGSITVSEMNYVGLDVISTRALSATEAAEYQYIV